MHACMHVEVLHVCVRARACSVSGMQCFAGPEAKTYTFDPTFVTDSEEEVLINENKGSFFHSN